jgi:hypothetical protein
VVLSAFQPYAFSIYSREKMVFPRRYSALQPPDEKVTRKLLAGFRRIRHCAPKCQITGFVVNEAPALKVNRTPVFIGPPPLSVEFIRK